MWLITSHAENQTAYPCIDWVDRDIIGIKTVGGKEFNLYNDFYVGNGIVLACGKPQRFNL